MMGWSISAKQTLMVDPGLPCSPFCRATKLEYSQVRPAVLARSLISSCETLLLTFHRTRHLARFKFTPTDTSPAPSCPLKIEVFPDDPSATKPFFTAIIHPMRWLPSFPVSSGWLAYLRKDTDLVQPPLPKGDTPELCGTYQWKRLKGVLHGQNTRLV